MSCGDDARQDLILCLNLDLKVDHDQAVLVASHISSSYVLCSITRYFKVDCSALVSRHMNVEFVLLYFRYREICRVQVASSQKLPFVQKIAGWKAADRP